MTLKELCSKSLRPVKINGHTAHNGEAAMLDDCLIGPVIPSAILTHR
jgi:hypothetical protein